MFIDQRAIKFGFHIAISVEAIDLLAILKKNLNRTML